MFQLFPDVLLHAFDLDVASVPHICCNGMFPLFQSSVAASVFMLQVTSVLYGYCICFHTYVALVCFKYFICLRHTLHSSVSYCTCFMLFGESRGAGEWGALGAASGSMTGKGAPAEAS
jgi:hypothetical protein